MLYRTDIGGTRPLVQVDAPTLVTPVGDARQESFERFANIQLGKQALAEIISRFDDGTFLVNVSKTAVRLNLPEGAKVGDSIPLTLVSRDPRPTFLVGQQSGGITATFSPAARLISNLLQSAQQDGGSAGLVGKTALLPSPASMNPAPLASTLQETLAYSGLFYESHVVQWAQGERSHAELMREPQARFRIPLSSSGSSPEAETSSVPHVAAKDADFLYSKDTAALAAKATSAPVSRPEENGHLQLDPRTGVLVKVVPSAVQEMEQKEPLALSREAAHMVTLQLDTLESNRVFWQGELWPGQPFEWVVSEETPKGHAEETQKVWRSTLRLSLPALGSIHASIQLVADKVQLSLRADSAEVVGLLRANGDELADALKASGTSLDFMDVGIHG